MRPLRVLTYLFLWIIFLTLPYPQRVIAQGPPIQTDTPIMLGIQGRGIRISGKWIRKATLITNGQKISFSPKETVDTWITPIAFPYNFFSDKFQIGLVLPFMKIRMNKTGNQLSNSGIGDIQVFAKYLLYQRDGRNKTFRIASKIGIKLATGKKQLPLPLGSGSTDYIFSTVAGWIAGRIGIYAEGLYHLNTSNGNLTYGDAFGYNLAFGYRLLPAIYETYPSPQLNGFIEINGWKTNKNRLDNKTINNSGGNIVFLTPGLQYIGGRHWLVEVAFQYPLINQLNGNQLSVDWTLSIGTRILLF